ncbi:FtsX-like permease family protein [Pseudodesulfovibrio thermohalotolerans]|uniref:ABC transporter permease n=1 Tax=Pseudodesulfovibrio thermohalotolerans TaxID=2880651 RepID=UPI002441702D|nr:FtsX-like permease family protein [Pseudodesulfovibrio thermohalotolerans]WFS62744.1 FtsX-like permease family protein [Pseudodesulfovibrio thermohalotolerans]
MNILTIPLRNSRRKPWRTGLLALVFTLGVMSVVSLDDVSRVIGDSLEKKLTAYGANILVAPKVETLAVSYGGFTLGAMNMGEHSLPGAETVEAIRSIGLKDRIAAIAPKFITSTVIRDHRVGVVGVHWQEELGIKSYWAIDGAYPEAERQMLAGSVAAARLGLGIGDVVRLGPDAYTVTGILHQTGGDDDKMLITDLASLQQTMGTPDRIHFVEVSALCSGCPIEDIVAQIREALPDMRVNALQSVVKQRMYSVTFVKDLAMIVSLVILLTASAMVGVSMLSAVNERKKEIGILRSLGYARGQVFAIFCVEAFFIGVLAGAAGYVAGYAVSFRILDVLDVAADADIAFDWLRYGGVCAVMAGLSVTAALIPAWKAAKVEPSEALLSL